MSNDNDKLSLPIENRGNGDEIQQRVGTSELTTNHGVPVSDNQNSLRAYDRGPTLLEDFVLREKIFHLGNPPFN